MVRVLLDRDFEVKVSTRGTGTRQNLEGLRYNHVCGDDTRPGVLEDWVPGHELVIDAAAPYALDLHDQMQSHAQRLAAAEDRMTRLIASAAKAGATLVHIGSIMTDPASQQSSLKRRIVEAAHPYFKIKRRLQCMAVEAAQDGHPVVIVLPSSLLGPWNLRPFHHCYVSAVMSGGMPASFPEMINLVDVRDAAESIVRITEAGWLGRAVPIAGHDISVHDLTDQIVELAQVRRPPRWRALSAGAAVLYGAEAMLGSVGLRSPYPSLPVLLTLASGSVPMGAVQRSLGPPLRQLKETLSDEIEWHRARGCS